MLTNIVTSQRVEFQTKDSTQNEEYDNSVVGVKMLNIEAGRSGLRRGRFPGKPPRGASAGDAQSHTAIHTQKTQFKFFVQGFISSYINVPV